MSKFAFSAFNLKELEKYCAMPTKDLVEPNKYKYINRGAKILGVAHCDYVEIPYYFKSYVNSEKDWMAFCPRFDDRIGVYLLMEVLSKLGMEYDILLTDNEEKGGSTAGDFKNPANKTYNWIFEVDRRGCDAVTYCYREMDDVLKPYFKKGAGSFSDISTLAWMQTGAFNIGVGYHHEHTSECYCLSTELFYNISRLLKFYNENKDTRFEHKHIVGPPVGVGKHQPYGGWTGYGGGYSSYDDYADYDYYSNKFSTSKTYATNNIANDNYSKNFDRIFAKKPAVQDDTEIASNRNFWETDFPEYVSDLYNDFEQSLFDELTDEAAEVFGEADSPCNEAVNAIADFGDWVTSTSTIQTPCNSETKKCLKKFGASVAADSILLSNIRNSVMRRDMVELNYRVNGMYNVIRDIDTVSSDNESVVTELAWEAK